MAVASFSEIPQSIELQKEVAKKGVRETEKAHLLSHPVAKHTEANQGPRNGP